jgi:hypothetical protein
MVFSKDIAPRIFKMSKKKNCKVPKALEYNFWFNQINIDEGFDLEHIQQFVTLWKLLSDIHLVHEEADTIHWKFTNNGKYSASSAYKMQFGYLSATTLNASIWNVGQLRTAKNLHVWLCKIEFRRQNSRRKKGMAKL